MINFLRKLFCFHAWEYEQDINSEWYEECRKCEKVRKYENT